MFDKSLPMTGFEQRTLVSEATALPTDPNHCPSNGILGSLNTLYAKIPYLFVVASAELKISIKAFGQFYEHSTIVNYDASIEIYNRGAFITLVTSISHFQMPRHTWDYQKVVKS